MTKEQSEKQKLPLTTAQMTQISEQLKHVAAIFDESRRTLAELEINQVEMYSLKTLNLGLDNLSAGAIQMQKAVLEKMKPQLDSIRSSNSDELKERINTADRELAAALKKHGPVKAKKKPNNKQA